MTVALCIAPLNGVDQTGTSLIVTCIACLIHLVLGATFRACIRRVLTTSRCCLLLAALWTERRGALEDGAFVLLPVRLPRSYIHSNVDRR